MQKRPRKHKKEGSSRRGSLSCDSKNAKRCLPKSSLSSKMKSLIKRITKRRGLTKKGRSKRCKRLCRGSSKSVRLSCRSRWNRESWLSSRRERCWPVLSSRCMRRIRRSRRSSSRNWLNNKRGKGSNWKCLSNKRLANRSSC